MRIINNLFYTFFAIVLILSCSINKKIYSKYTHKGEIEIEGSNDYRLKYFLIIDSVYNLRFKIYSISAIKLSELILKRDSINIIYIIDNSYKGQILELFKKYNNDGCLKNIILDIFNTEVFSDSMYFNNKNHCYKRNIILNEKCKVYEISNLDNEKFLSISTIDFSDNYYEILMKNGIKVKLKIFN